MDFATVDGASFGRSLRGLGLNLLVRDVMREAEFLSHVFGFEVLRQSADYAILRYSGALLQWHADPTYNHNALFSLLPEAGPRGGGAEFRLYDTDPVAAVARAKALGATILAEPLEKPHGLIEAIILCESGYAWLPSQPLPAKEKG